MRKSDRMIHAQDLTLASSNGQKRFDNWYRLDGSKAFIAALQRHGEVALTSEGYAGEVVSTTKTGPVDERGVWIHPKLVVQLATWISPDFAVLATSWVNRIMAGDITMMAVIRDAHDAVHGTETTVAIVTKERRRPEYVEPVRAAPPSIRVMAKDTQHRLSDFVCRRLPKERVGPMMAFLGDKACQAATGKDAGQVRELNGLKHGSARDAMDDEQLSNAWFFMKKVMARAGEGDDLHEVALAVRRDMAPFVRPMEGATDAAVLKRNRQDMKDDLLLTRPLNQARFERGGAKRIKC